MIHKFPKEFNRTRLHSPPILYQDMLHTNNDINNIPISRGNMID